MTEIISNKNQDKLFEFLIELLKEELRKEWRRRRDEAHENFKDFMNDESVKELRVKRTLKLTILQKLSDLYKETGKERRMEFPCGYRWDLEEYVKDEDGFLEKFNNQTDSEAEAAATGLAMEKAGCKTSFLILEENLKKELRARLAVQPIDTFQGIVEKITKDININKFFKTE